jgi:hypothetical protein
MGTSDNKEEINSQIFVMLHTDHIGWCKSIYHTIMTTMPHPTIRIPPYIIGQSWVVFLYISATTRRVYEKKLVKMRLSAYSTNPATISPKLIQPRFCE